MKSNKLSKEGFSKNIVVVLALLFIINFYFYHKSILKDTSLTVSINVKTEKSNVFQVFFVDKNKNNFSEEDSVKVSVNASERFQKIDFVLPQCDINKLRLDFGDKPGSVLVDSIIIKNKIIRLNLTSNKILDIFNNTNQVDKYCIGNEKLLIKSNSQDPFIYTDDISDILISNKTNLYIRDVCGIFVLLILFVFIYKIIKINKINFTKVILVYKNSSINFFMFLKEILENKNIIVKLSINDFKVKYIGSYLGIIWAFIQPIITLGVYWFVFEVGFKSAPIEKFPFILWLMCGMIPWFFFSEAMSNATNSLIEYSYLVKKVVFHISILPIVKIISSMFVHIFFIIFIFVMFMIYGFEPNVFNVQIFYYTFAMFILLMGISWLTSSLTVFIKDVREIVGVILQLGFWLTPIFWSYKMLPDKYNKLLDINPIYYIVRGYRDTFINHVWFWERTTETIYFWSITLFLFILGALIFKRLRPHFSDVL